jgi:hypothetical protein
MQKSPTNKKLTHTSKRPLTKKASKTTQKNFPKTLHKNTKNTKNTLLSHSTSISFSTSASNYDDETALLNPTTGPEPAAIRATLRQLLRNTNPRIQGIRPRRNMGLSHGFQAILNEYRVKSNCSVIDAWKYHSTATQLVQALKANVYNANTLYQSGWKPARPQKEQVQNVAKHIGVGLNETKDEIDLILNPEKMNLGDMLLFSNNNNNKIRVDPKTDAQQILGDDSVFHDIFGGDFENFDNFKNDIKNDNKKIPTISESLNSARINTDGINEDLQRALFEDLGFSEGLNEPSDAVLETNTNNNHNDNNDVQMVQKLDPVGFPIRFNPSKQRKNGRNGWEVKEHKLTTVFSPVTKNSRDSGFVDEWDSALSQASGHFNFVRSKSIQIINTMQHNDNVYGLGLLGCLLNDVENISTPKTFTGAFYGLESDKKF